MEQEIGVLISYSNTYLNSNEYIFFLLRILSLFTLSIHSPYLHTCPYNVALTEATMKPGP
jgi:hypothetical protein